MADNVDSEGNTLLHHAVFKGVADCVKICSDKKFPINAQNNKGLTALHIACSEDLEDIVTLLIKNGADINIKTNKEIGVLHTACKIQNFDILKILLDNGADVNIQDGDGQTVLHLICLNLCDVIISSTRNEMCTISFITKVCTVYNDWYEKVFEIVNILLTKGTDVSIKNKMSETALDNMLTRIKDFLFQKHKSKCEYCFKDYFDLNHKISIVEPYSKNMEERFFPLVIKLVKAWGDCNLSHTFLHGICLLAFDDVIDVILKRGINVNLQDNYRKTAIYFALKYIIQSVFNSLHAHRSSIEIISKLFKSKADVNAHDLKGRTILHHVVKFYDKDFLVGNNHPVADLISLGADVNASDTFGTTPLHLSKNTYVIKSLLEHGADINSCDSYGNSNLHEAVSKIWDISVFDEVVQKEGTQVNIQNNFGETPLHIAVGLIIDNDFFSRYRQRPSNADEEAIMKDFYFEYAKILLNNGALASIRSICSGTSVELAGGENIYIPFFKHLILLVTCGMHPHMEINVNNDSVTLFKRQSLEECRKMKNTRIGTKSVYDILKSYRIPVYVTNTAFASFVHSLNCRKQFPLFSVILRNKLSKDQEKLGRLSYAVAMCLKISNCVPLNSSCNWYNLPEDIQLNILSYLTNEELKTFTRAFTPRYS